MMELTRTLPNQSKIPIALLQQHKQQGLDTQQKYHAN